MNHDTTKQGCCGGAPAPKKNATTTAGCCGGSSASSVNLHAATPSTAHATTIATVSSAEASGCCGGSSASSANLHTTTPSTAHATTIPTVSSAETSGCCGGASASSANLHAATPSTTHATTIPTVSSAETAGCCGGASASSAGCCGETTMTTLSLPVTQATTAPPAADVRETVREKYGEVARGTCVGVGCCGAPPDDEQALAQFGYTAEQRAAIPEGANLGLGCGNPIAHARLQPGETVLDLGSGAGIDCFLAAREVGPTGRVIGVDMTTDMLERARRNRIKVDATQVEFRLGEIEHLPVADGTVDCIISNCVVNLSPDKPQVFREAMRVLKPGGRLVVSDLVLLRELSPELQRNVDLYVGCIAGASLKEEYLRLLRDAGFAEVRVVEEIPYTVGMERLAEDSPERDAFAAVTSVKVWAVKRA